nr:MAG TPA: hypothetical protein [Caudoviricetes sp.]
MYLLYSKSYYKSSCFVLNFNYKNFGYTYIPPRHAISRDSYMVVYLVISSKLY